jgi:diguanylate cyclase (GGDEF)-like protein
LLCQYGGDEYVCGLPKTDVNGAFEVCERIMKGVATIQDHLEKISGRFGISIGTNMIRKGDDFKIAFRRADQALYSAKQSRKNRIIIK